MIFSRNKGKAKQRDRQQDMKNLLENFPASSSFAESYRTMRTNLFFTAIEKELKSVVVTSSVEGEGKTTTCINLAYTIAQANKKVLLVDSDLRRSHLSSLYDLRGKHGLSDIVGETYGTHLTQGSLDEVSVNDLTQMTRLQNRTCCLNLKNDETNIRLFFEKGRISDIFRESGADDKNGKLINILISDKLITEKEAELAFGELNNTALHLGSILSGMGFMSQKDISRVLSMYSIKAIKTASAMGSGTFEFSSQETTKLKKSPEWKVDFDELYSEFTINSDNYQSSLLKKATNEAIKQISSSNLYILPSGTVPPNPSELIGSGLTEYLIDFLKHEFDFIIIDTPPVMPATDALLMAPRTDGTILVIKAGHADRRIIQNVVDQYHAARQPIIGTVLNRVNMKKEGYYRYYKKYYSSYYGQQPKNA